MIAISPLPGPCGSGYSLPSDRKSKRGAAAGLRRQTWPYASRRSTVTVRVADEQERRSALLESRLQKIQLPSADEISELHSLSQDSRSQMRSSSAKAKAMSPMLSDCLRAWSYSPFEETLPANRDPHAVLQC